MPETSTMEVGRLPMPGKALPEGRYVLTILDGDTLLIAYDFVIVGLDDEGFASLRSRETALPAACCADPGLATFSFCSNLPA